MDNQVTNDQPSRLILALQQLGDEGQHAVKPTLAIVRPREELPAVFRMMRDVSIFDVPKTYEEAWCKHGKEPSPRVPSDTPITRLLTRSMAKEMPSIEDDASEEYGSGSLWPFKKVSGTAKKKNAALLFLVHTSKIAMTNESANMVIMFREQGTRSLAIRGAKGESEDASPPWTKLRNSGLAGFDDLDCSINVLTSQLDRQQFCILTGKNEASTLQKGEFYAKSLKRRNDVAEPEFDVYGLRMPGVLLILDTILNSFCLQTDGSKISLQGSSAGKVRFGLANI
ncbi:hypothetical protein B0H14DRAFT_2572651 [Mycena olivaceomarginata]|nr:hypothetical protein B0H14DRAFT_2572651 [Mycena olivaceomarginata]